MTILIMTWALLFPVALSKSEIESDRMVSYGNLIDSGLVRVALQDTKFNYIKVPPAPHHRKT